MGKHAVRRHAAPRPSLRAVLQKTALLVVLPVAVGTIALNAPANDASSDSVEGTFSSAATEKITHKAKKHRPAVKSARLVASPALAKKMTAIYVDRTPALSAAEKKKRKKPRIPANFVRIAADSTQETAFRVSSFNVLGFGHTVKGGNKPGYADGRTRMTWTVQSLRANDVSVAGFQEFQTEQFNHFVSIAGGEYAVYPGTSLGRAAVQNSIVWRRSNWELVEGHTTPIPYFGGDRIQMPYVLLRNLQTGRHVWFMNFHNPADAHGPAQRWRDLAVSIEIGLINSLKANTGYPVIMTGDFNDRERFMCRVAPDAGMHSSDGAYYDGTCHLPRPMWVDWVVGSSQVNFSGHVGDRSAFIRKQSDHPMIRAWAVVEPAYTPDDCVEVPGESGEEPALYCPPS